MTDEKAKFVIRETIVLKKFNGDDQTKEPVEIITIEMENGKEVKRTIAKKEVKQDGTH
jgi:hypothetical protein